MDVFASDPKSRDVGHHVRALAFSFYSEDEVRSLSVREITSAQTFDELGRPLKNGLYDPALGTTSHRELCETCQLGYQECPGHFGHIELAVPVLNPLLVGTLFRILRAKCWYCNQFRSSRANADLLLGRLYYIDAGMYREAQELQLPDVPSTEKEKAAAEVLSAATDAWARKKANRRQNNRAAEWRATLHDFMTDAIQGAKCSRCGAAAIKLRRDDTKIFRLAKTKQAMRSDAVTGHKLKSLAGKMEQVKIGENEGDATDEIDPDGEVGKTMLVTTMEMEGQLKALWEAEPGFCSLVWGCRDRLADSKSADQGYRVFFLRVLAVPPSRFRPASRDASTGMATEHPQNVFLGKVLAANRSLLEMEGDDNQIRRTRLVMELQNNINALMDSTRGGGQQGAVNATGIRQQLEHKEGLFRMHMMGKRVNHSARSVIGPDPFLETNEVGVPKSFAIKLSYAEPVTPYNVTKLRKMVENGPNGYPGATAVEDENGNVINLLAGRPSQRRAQAKLLDKTRRKSVGYVPETAKRVHRHLQTGDVVLFNRQPSLHRASIMAHKVRVLPKERTIRFHYANCGSYNADFDGDEMNLHFPQDEVSRAEAEMVVLADRQYSTPTSGMPLRGLIQDHVVAGVLLSKRDTFLTRADFQQLLFGACDSLIKPDQAVKLPPPAIAKPERLWTGKQLISSVLELVAGGRCRLNLRGKTRTKSDMVGDEEAEVVVVDGHLIQGVLDKSQFGSSAFGLVHAFYEVYGAKAAGLLLSTLSRLFTLYLRVHGHTTGIDDLMLDGEAERSRHSILRQARREAGRQALAHVLKVDEDSPQLDAQPLERLVEEVTSQRDGDDTLDAAVKTTLSKVSSKVLKVCLPGGLVKRFPRNGFAMMTGTGAKGSVVNSSQISCQLGQTELEGKRVPRSASGATLPCFAPFDSSVRAGGYITGRFLTGIKPPEYFFHCMAGREGLVDTAVKTARSGYLQRCLIKGLEGAQLRYDMTVRDSDNAVLQFLYGDDGIDPSNSSWLFKHLDWQATNAAELARALGAPSLKKLPKLSTEQRALLKAARSGETLDTILEACAPSATSKFGAVSDKFWSEISSYADRDPHKLAEKLGRKTFERFMLLRYQSATAQPGDAVGVLAAQGIGEPSTQMTLNTFHFAGMGAAHVTLGIPRLRELLMTASKHPKTPTMNLPLYDTVDELSAERFVRRLRRIRVVDLLTAVDVQDEGFVGSGANLAREYRVQLEFPPEDLYQEALELSFDELRRAVSQSYMRMFRSGVTRAIAKVGQAGGSGSTQKANVTAVNGGDDADAAEPNGAPDLTDGEDDEVDPLVDEDPAGGEGDASDERRARRKGEEKTFYDEEAEEHESGEEEDNDGEDPMEEDASGSNDAHSENGEASDAGRTDVTDDLAGRRVTVTASVPVSAWGRVMVDDIAQEAATGAIIREVPSISRCFLERTDQGTMFVQTEGSNLQAIWEYDTFIDVNRVLTNDIYLILQTYGVEAARAALIDELGMVFKAYGIPVDKRHIGLIADYMTVHGTYRPFNRIGMDTAPSGLQKMSFETSLKFLTEAAMNAEIDNLESPSARLAVGEVVRCGTGTFDLLQRIEV